MKKYDLINLKNDIPYKKYGLEKNTHGIIIDVLQNHVQVLFFNPLNNNEFTLIYINKSDIDLDKEVISENIKSMLEKNIEKLKLKENYTFTSPKFKLFDKVELIVEKDKYVKFGLHKGEIGFIIDNIVISNSIEIDFPNLDENNEHFGEAFSIKIEDLRVIE